MTARSDCILNSNLMETHTRCAQGLLPVALLALMVACGIKDGRQPSATQSITPVGSETGKWLVNLSVGAGITGEELVARH